MMKKTVPLTVASSQHFPFGRFAIHPNEGFDLGMMTRTYPVQWCTDVSLTDFVNGSAGTTNEVNVELLNECPPRTLQMNVNQWKKIGMPPHVVIIYDGNRLYIQPLQK